MRNRTLALGFLLATVACTDGKKRVEEPIKPHPKTMDDDAGYAPDDDGAAGGGAADAFGEPDSAPAAAPAPDPKKPSGGIISSGAKSSGGSADGCKRLKTAAARQRCLEKAKEP